MLIIVMMVSTQSLSSVVEALDRKVMSLIPVNAEHRLASVSSHVILKLTNKKNPRTFKVRLTYNC